MSDKSKILTIIFLIIFSQLSCGLWGYPTQEEIDQKMNQFNLLKNTSEKAALLKNLLNDMRNPESKTDQDLLHTLLSKLAADYRREKDEAILIAVDSTKIDGGFANEICSFYDHLISEQGFIDRYSKNENRPAIERCGVLLSNEGSK